MPIQSFGKAFLLPLDVLLGWIFTNADWPKKSSSTMTNEGGTTYRKDYP